MTTAITIRPADSAADVDAVADLIALSFNHLPACQYLVPKDSDRLLIMRDFFHLLTEHAADGNGEVLLTADGTAAAVWFDRTRELPEPRSYEKRLAYATGEYVDRFNALDQLFDEHHPGDEHWHLAFLAVHPTQWGNGIGSALMNHTHSRLDRDGIPAYLEATNDDNCRVYQRHGYQDMNPLGIHLPDGTPFYRMWRPATA